MFKGRKRITIPAALTVGLMGIAGLNSAGPAQAEPNIQDVKQQVDRLYRQAEVASERYNAAKLRLTGAQDRLKGLNADLDRQTKVVSKSREQVAAAVVDQFNSGGIGTAGQMVLSDNPDTLMQNLNALNAADVQRSEILTRYTDDLKQLKLRKGAVADEVSGLKKTEEEMSKEKAKVDEKASKAKALLNRLEAKARERLLASSRNGGAVSAADASAVAGSASGRAKAAVSFAMGQIGKAYVWGAAGPGAYDCSGLTMAAWSKAGVGLPHQSGAQFAGGRKVSMNELQPGDLVFYYSPISHVGMYVGGGNIVNALNPSTGVRLSPVNSMPVSGAVRPG